MDQRDAKLQRGRSMLRTAGRRQGPIRPGIRQGRRNISGGNKEGEGVLWHVTHKASRSQRPPTNAGLKDLSHREVTTQPSLGPHTRTASVAGHTCEQHGALLTPVNNMEHLHL